MATTTLSKVLLCAPEPSLLKPAGQAKVSRPSENEMYRPWKTCLLRTETFLPKTSLEVLLLCINQESWPEKSTTYLTWLSLVEPPLELYFFAAAVNLGLFKPYRTQITEQQGSHQLRPPEVHAFSLSHPPHPSHPHHRPHVSLSKPPLLAPLSHV